MNLSFKSIMKKLEELRVEPVWGVGKTSLVAKHVSHCDPLDSGHAKSNIQLFRNWKNLLSIAGELRPVLLKPGRYLLKQIKNSP